MAQVIEWKAAERVTLRLSGEARAVLGAMLPPGDERERAVARLVESIVEDWLADLGGAPRAEG